MPGLHSGYRWFLPVVLGLATGCGALRCQKVSEESIAQARRLSLQGMEAQQHNDWVNAEALFADAVMQCPHDERARCGYAESLWRRGACPDAIAHMEESVRLSGHDPERLVQLGNMYLGVGDLTRAADQADRAIAASPELAIAWALRGDVLERQGQLTAALASYHRALAYQTPFPTVQLAIAEIYRQEHRPERSLATLQALASSFPAGQAPPDLLVRQSLALQALGRHHEAARTLAQAAGRANPSADLLCALARAQWLAGETTAARQSLAAALAREPDHPACRALAQDLGWPQSAIAAVHPMSSATR
jgi:tetratricopeptide (TPR) repeat protein